MPRSRSVGRKKPTDKSNMDSRVGGDESAVSIGKRVRGSDLSASEESSLTATSPRPRNHSKDVDSEVHAVPLRSASASSRIIAVCGFLFSLVGVYRLIQLTSSPTPLTPSEPGAPASSSSWLENYERVFWCAWITAAATGLGALPLLCFRRRESRLSDDTTDERSTAAAPTEKEIDEDSRNETILAASNAAAAGMMLAASVYLIFEGVSGGHGGDENDAVKPGGGTESSVTTSENMNSGSAVGTISSIFAFASSLASVLASYNAGMVFVGVTSGILFVVLSKHWLDSYEDLKFAGFDGISVASARRMLLILSVMTLHSLSEGMAIGVSFTTKTFGQLISAALAVHNIPEGLATCLILAPRGIPLLEAALWAVFTSLPQPLMALPAYASVTHFKPLLPLGLGFAAGAMAWVSFAELLAEASAILGNTKSALIALVAAALYAGCQMTIETYIS